jgi:hypothetical protein
MRLQIALSDTPKILAISLDGFCQTKRASSCSLGHLIYEKTLTK